MNDLREYTFGDWYRLFRRALPALLLASLLIIAPIIALAALIWFLIPIYP